MTEDEAKTKWCPFARQMVTAESKGAMSGPIAVGSANRFEDDPNGRPRGSMCVASGCMAWRWGFSPREATAAAVDAPMTHAKRPFVADGFCGLAGRP